MIDHPTENTEKSDPFAVLEAARRLLEQAGDQLPAGAMHAVAALAAHEVLRCLDPRHHTTRQQAVDAVFSTSPFAETLTWQPTSSVASDPAQDPAQDTGFDPGHDSANGPLLRRRPASQPSTRRAPSKPTPTS